MGYRIIIACCVAKWGYRTDVNFNIYFGLSSSSSSSCQIYVWEGVSAGRENTRQGLAANWFHFPKSSSYSNTLFLQMRHPDRNSPWTHHHHHHRRKRISWYPHGGSLMCWQWKRTRRRRQEDEGSLEEGGGGNFPKLQRLIINLVRRRLFS